MSRNPHPRATQKSPKEHLNLENYGLDKHEENNRGTGTLLASKMACSSLQETVNNNFFLILLSRLQNMNQNELYIRNKGN